MSSATGPGYRLGVDVSTVSKLEINEVFPPESLPSTRAGSPGPLWVDLCFPAAAGTGILPSQRWFQTAFPSLRIILVTIRCDSRQPPQPFVYLKRRSGQISRDATVRGRLKPGERAARSTILQPKLGAPRCVVGKGLLP